MRTSRDMANQRKRALEDVEEEERSSNRCKEWKKKACHRPERRRSTRSKKFHRSLTMATTKRKSIKLFCVERIDDQKVKITLWYTNAVVGSAEETVTISQLPSCSCSFYSGMKKKEICMHIIWTLINVCKIKEEDAPLQQIAYTQKELQKSLKDIDM